MHIKYTMKKKYKTFLKRILTNNFYNIIKQKYLRLNVLIKWYINGKSIPPPHMYKQMVIHHYRRKNGCKIFVETGTYLGDMIEAQLNYFSKIYSVELSYELFEKAKERFKHYDNIKILQGDSGKVLHNIIDEINLPTLFWLDGHYSAGFTAKGDKNSPIKEELNCILDKCKSDYVLLIDDARCFNGKNDYPTIETLKSLIDNKQKRFRLIVKNDIIRIIPK